MSSTKNTTTIKTTVSSTIGSAVQMTHLDFEGNGSEMGFFFVLSLLSVFFLLNQLNGRIFRMKIFLMNRDFHLVKNPRVISALTQFIRLMSWFSLSLPFLALGVWAAGLIARAVSAKEKPSGGITVALTGASFFCFMSCFFRVKWNHYKFDMWSGIYFCLTFLFLTAYQFVSIFLSVNPSLFGMSAIFLSANCLVMMMIVFLQSAVKDGSIEDIIKTKLPVGSQPRNPSRNEDFEQEIAKERDNKDYLPTTDCLNDIFTIAKPEYNSKFESPAYSSGLQNFFGNLNPNIKRGVTIGLWLIATGILVIYSFVIRSKFPETSRYGFITMIAILTTDVLVYLIQNAEIVQSATPLAGSLFLNRFFLIIFGSENWIYGYIVIYVVYGVLLSTIIAQKRFPLEDSIKNYDLDQIAADLKAKKQGVTNNMQASGPATGVNNALKQLDNVQSKLQEKFSVLKQPEYPMIIISLIYLLILGLLALIKPARVPLPNLTVQNRELHFIVAWAFSIIIVLAYFTSMAVGLLFIRRKQGNAQKVYFEARNVCARKLVRIERYWFFMVLNMASLVAIGILAWWVTRSWAACILIIFIDAYILTVLNFYTHFISNDFQILQDIAMVNKRVDNYNNRQDALKKEIEDVKQKIKNGQNTSGVISKSILERAQQMVKEGEERKGPPSQPPAPQQQEKTNWDVSDTKPRNNQPSQITQPSSADVKPKPAPPAPPKQPEPAQVKVQVQDSNEDLVNDEIQKMNDAAREKGRKNKAADDGIYEGGEPEPLMPIGAPQSNNGQEITELLVDPDEEEVVDESKFKVRYKTVEDWRKQNNFFSAFWQGKLRKNDYQIIFSWVASAAVLLVGGWLICAQTDSYIGVTIFIPFAHYTLAAYAFMKTLSTDEPMNIVEYCMFGLSYFVQYGWGVWNLWLTYNFGDKKKKLDAGTYIVVNLIVIPFITSCVCATAKWIDSKGKMSPFFIVQLAITLLQGVGMLVCAFIFMTWVQGVICSCVIGVLGYIAFQVIIYLKNDNYMPPMWFLINVGIVVAAIIATFIASGFVGELSVFMGFSISTWLLALLLIIFGVGKTFFDIRGMKTKPVFFSPWVFPIYIFNPKKQDVQPNNLPAGCILGAFVLMIFWSILATAWFSPVHVGVALSILFENLLLLAVIYIVQISHLQLHKLREYIDGKILRRAWLEAKATYVHNRHAFSREELLTYEELIQRKNMFRNKMRIMEGRAGLSFEEQFEGVKMIPQVSDAEINQWLNKNLVDLSQPLSCYSYLFELEKDVATAYRQELELITMFQLLIIAYTEIYYDQKKKYLFNFLIEKRPILLAVDIVINIPATVPQNVQYAKVIMQIQALPQDKFAMFNDLREAFVQEQRGMDDKRREQAANEENKAREREGQNADRERQRKEGISRNNDSTPVEQWVDTKEKYDKILAQCKQTGKKFTDTDFKADNASLGPNLSKRPESKVDKWIRAGDQVQDQKCVLYKDRANALDVVQGALGDCYFLSAISVLGDKNVEAMLQTTEAEWKLTGCFCVRFYRGGKEEFVIVDDHFPAKMENNRYSWVFCKGGDLGDELWSMVLEKAYAKLYGGYEFIEAGKVHYALADMIEGFPQQLDLKNDAKNLEVFWAKLLKYQKQGALLGAGSPENPQGDAVTNQLGIVQGHAYAILDMQEVDESKLMQLRNPHGKSGAEWRGDWCDTDPQWNLRMKKKLNYEPKDHEDGVFWMDAFDFIQQFSYVYICRIFTQQQGWYNKPLSGEWRGASAEGLPNRANPSARIELNPQYAVTIHKPCEGFILLRQKDVDPSGASTFKGKLSIFFMISRSNGKRIKKVVPDEIVTRSGNPTNLLTISADCDFDTSVNYPYTFSLLIANTGKGPTGEGKFEVVVYSQDPAMTVEAFPEVQ